MKAKIETTKREIEFDLHLTMNEREARALLTVLRHVGGKPSGARGTFGKIASALHDAGIRPGGVREGSGSIYFPDTWADFEKVAGW